METKRTYTKHHRIRPAVIAGAFFFLLTLAACGSRLVASTIRLIRQEGTVHVQDESGKDVKIREKMRLQEGSRLETEETSFAGVSLDDTKMVTLDELSRSEFVSSGKQIELKLTEGSLFFNVTEPLEEDEKFEIKTSTMAIGIRGTSGYVTADEDGNDSLIVMDGKVHVTATDKKSGEVKETEVRAGQKMTVLLPGEGRKEIVFQFDDIKEKELPPLALRILSEEDDLLEKVCDDTGWSEDEILDVYSGEEGSNTSNDSDGQGPAAEAADGEWIEHGEQGAPDYYRTFTKSDGSEARSEWLEIAGEKYYFEANGELAMNTTTPDGYHVNAEGVYDGGSEQTEQAQGTEANNALDIEPFLKVAFDNYRTREFIVYEYAFDDNGKISEMRERSIGRGGQYEETCRYVNSELVSRTFAPGEGGYDETPYTVEYRSEHDGQGRLIRSIGYYNDTAIASVEYVYDEQGRLTRKTDSLPATARSGAAYILSDEQEQIVTEYRYSTDGALSQITETMIDSSGYEVILEHLIINGDQLSNGEYEGSRDGAIITLQDDEDSYRSYVSREDLISGAV